MKMDREKIVDEAGNDPMDYDTESQNFHLEALTRFRLYCDAQEKQQINENIETDSRLREKKSKSKNRHYSQYSNEQRLLFVYYNRVKVFNAAKSTRFAGGIAEHLKEDKDWNILEKQTNLVNRPKPQLEGKHRVHLLSFYDENPQARLVDAMNSLTGQFENLNIHKKCNFSFKKITIHPVARNSETNILDHLAWGTPAIVETPSTMTAHHTILGAISAKFVEPVR
ncbi:hypothetical protein CLU79DRAFT_805252 [Phycomyces nitens]|nr:hypothetical protein CLU79DRAFT_805252 [Phycomyces nitens]